MLRLLVLDIDGVLSPGEGAPLDLALLQCLAVRNDRARHDASGLAITLCTGRPAPYVEVLMQAIHGFVPAVYEHGAGLYVSEPYSFQWHPELTATVQGYLKQLQTVLHETLVATDLALWQPGKTASLSLFPQSGIPLSTITHEARRLASPYSAELLVEEGATCVNVMVRGLDKAAGVRWLARATGIPLQYMAGVGDAPGDIPFMQAVEWSAAPANAHPSVKQMASYTSPYDHGRGVMDILSRLPV